MSDRVHLEPIELLLAGVGLAPAAAPAVGDAAAESLAPPAAATGSNSTATAAPAPHLREVDARVEAVLMVADGPLPLAALAAAIDRPVVVARQAVERLRSDYDGETGGARRGWTLQEVATGWRLTVRSDYDGLVREFLGTDTAARLSSAALETLAVVAYRQPVTRGQIAAIRAVAVDQVVRSLVGRGLIEVVGQVPETGAALYGTTAELLVALGIDSIDELPPIAPLLADAHEVNTGERAVANVR